MAIKKKTRGSLIIISGTTCAGKGTIIRKLIEKNPDIYLSVSYTSRPIRKGEVRELIIILFHRKSLKER